MASNRKNEDALSWAKAFDEVTKSQGLKPKGEGWAEFKQLKESLGVGVNRLHKFLREGAEVGRVEVFEGTKIGKNGRLVRCIWYRLK
jgi:hypothetical protein